MTQKSFNQFLAHLVLMNDLNPITVNIIELSDTLKLSKTEVENHLTSLQLPQRRNQVVFSRKIDNENWEISNNRGVYF